MITSSKHSCRAPRSLLLRLPHSHELSRNIVYNDVIVPLRVHRLAFFHGIREIGHRDQTSLYSVGFDILAGLKLPGD